MSAMAYGGLSQVIANSEQSRLSLKRLQVIQRTMLMTTRDFSQIIQRDIRDEFGDTKAYLVSEDGPGQLIEFTRSGRRNPAEQLRSHLVRVAYRYEDEELIRMYWPQLDRVQGMEPYESVLLEDVSNAELRYLDNNGEWHRQWPPLTSTTQTNNTIQLLAIEFKLELKDWGEIVRLYKVTA